MPTIYIDNQPHQVPEGQNLLHACLSLGFDIPYFCWHPALHSVGSCRLCAIKLFKDENDTEGKIVMSCMTPAKDGTRLSIDDPEAREFRAHVIEWLMLNHPHDCPICDEGGECHLQDMTVMNGHVYRRYRFTKRTYRNQKMGPFINHEMNRCIQCFRCVRFYRDYAGGKDFEFFSTHDNVYFGRFEDGVLESEFSGNLVEVCPTGVFTDKTLKKHYTRKWDLQTAPSICVHCGLGCNTIPGQRYGTLRRILNRYHHEINSYFLCDRGRFGYEFVNSEARVRRPMLRQGDSLAPADAETVLSRLADLVAAEKKIIGIGSPRASLEANFALRTLVGPDHFHAGLSESDQRLLMAILDTLRQASCRLPSLAEVQKADAVLILGEDVTNTAPMLDLALRQAVLEKPKEEVVKLKIPLWDDAPMREVIQEEKGPLFIASCADTKLDAIAAATYRAAPQDIARLGFLVAREIDPEAPGVQADQADSSRSRNEKGEPDSPDGTESELARLIARALQQAKRPLVVAGTGGGSDSIIRAAANVACALGKAKSGAGLFLTVPEVNSMGLALMDAKSLEEAMGATEDEKADTIVILENDLYRRAEGPWVDRLLSAFEHVVVLDHCRSRTADQAEVVLPAATFAETDGTLVNNEGRGQRFYKVCPPEGEVREGWRWLRELLVASGRSPTKSWRKIDQVLDALAQELSVFQPLVGAAPGPDFRIRGLEIPRQPPRYSGRTAMHADVSVHEPPPPADSDSPLVFSMEGYEGVPPAALINRYWAPGWNSVQALTKYQREVAGPLLGGDPGRRLLDPAPAGEVKYHRPAPEPFRPDPAAWLFVPLFHIFGAEELSVLAPGIKELVPAPYVALRPEDAERLKVNEGEEVEVGLAETARRLPVKLKGALPPGLAGLPAGLPDLEGLVLPAKGTIRRFPHE
jgi:NADH-quinone oxidoreductase subunit G